MLAVVLRAGGGPEQLRLEDVEDPEPAPGELLVRVRACAVCGHDLLARRGLLGTRLPQVLGHEIAGEVVVGADGFAPGDRVVLNQRLSCGRCVACRAGATNVCVSGLGFYGEDLPGGYAELVRALPTNAVHLPDAVDDTSAAGLVCGLGTGLHALHRLDVQPGETVLVTGAAGGVGLHVVSLARHLGATAVGAVRRAQQVEAVREAGAAEVVVAGDDGVYAAARATGRTIDAVVDCVGTPTLASSVRAVRAGGRIAVVGNVDPQALALRLGMVILKEVDVRGSAHATVEELAACVALAAAGVVTPKVEAFALADAAAAHRALEDGRLTGKVALVP